MVEFKVVLSDPRTGHAYNIDVSGGATAGFIGRCVGDEVNAAPIGLQGYKIEITGGSDRNGTPARKSLPIMGRRKLLLTGGVGFNPKKNGERRRKSIRGYEITADFVQINAKVREYGEKSLEDIFAPAEPVPEEGTAAEE